MKPSTTLRTQRKFDSHMSPEVYMSLFVNKNKNKIKKRVMNSVQSKRVSGVS